MTRDQWIEACADRYISVGDLDLENAKHFAEACADQQTESNGPNVSEWESPADAADEDMSYWEDDE